MNPDRDYLLDLALPDEREAARMLVKLAVSEPGENWTNESYGDIVDWELPATWAEELPM